MNTTQIPTQAQYEQNERALFNNQRNLVGLNFTRDERTENNREMFSHLCDNPALVAERIGWLIDGNYGYGAYQAWREIANSRMNKPAWLLQTIAALEWRVNARDLNKLWHKLSTDQQEKINHYIGLAIKAYELNLGA